MNERDDGGEMNKGNGYFQGVHLLGASIGFLDNLLSIRRYINYAGVISYLSLFAGLYCSTRVNLCVTRQS